MIAHYFVDRFSCCALFRAPNSTNAVRRAHEIEVQSRKLHTTLGLLGRQMFVQPKHNQLFKYACQWVWKKNSTILRRFGYSRYLKKITKVENKNLKVCCHILSTWQLFWSKIDHYVGALYCVNYFCLWTKFLEVF